MWPDVIRMLVGVAIMAAHRPLAAFALRQDHMMHGLFASRGLKFPAPPSEATAHNIYFYLGAVVCAVFAVRVWLGLH